VGFVVDKVELWQISGSASKPIIELTEPHSSSTMGQIVADVPSGLKYHSILKIKKNNPRWKIPVSMPSSMTQGKSRRI
jgi:hypothetical protein